MEEAKGSLEPLQETTKETVLGKHLIVDLWVQDPRVLDDFDYLWDSLLAAAQRGKFSIINVDVRKFSPHGVSGVVLLTESHMSIHTWPEHCYAALDIFACSGDPWAALEELKTRLLSERVEIYSLNRGTLTRGG